MENLILFMLASIGMCHILVDSTFFMPVRDWIKKLNKTEPWCFIDKILSCYQCCGMWAGMFCGICLLIHWPVVFSDILVVFMAGCAGSFLSSISANYLNYLSARSIVELPPEKEE